MKKREKQVEPVIVEGVPAWLVTFGDMMSLLLTFFILLFSVSEIKDRTKIYEIAQIFKGKIKITKPVFGYYLPRVDTDNDGLEEESEEASGKIGESGARKKRIKPVEGTNSEPLKAWDHIRLRTSASIFFKSGSASLSEAGRRLLRDTVMTGLIDKQFKIVLRGYGDSGDSGDPEAQFLLGYKRALTVHVFLISQGIPEYRMEIQSAGYRLFSYWDESEDVGGYVDILVPSRTLSNGPEPIE